MPTSMRAWLAVGLAAIGGGLGGYGGVRVVASLQTPAVAMAAAYHESAACSKCPAGISIDSVEVQARQGSTLFIIGGKWPSSADGLRTDVRLLTGRTVIVLHPHGSQGAFEVLSATDNGVPLPASGLAADIADGALLINVSPAFSAPMTFEFGLWDGTRYTGRLPRSGVLAWDGKSAPTNPGAAVPASQAPSPTTTGGSTEVTTLVAACAAVPTSAQVPPYLAFTRIGSATPTPDPRTQNPVRSVTAGLSASPLDVTAPYALVAILVHPTDTAPTGQSRPIDGAGTEQLYLYFDGTTKHKAIRTFSNGAWNTLLDTAAGDLTFALKADQVTFFWTGINAGDRFGFISAGAGATCAESGLSPQLAPQVPAQ